MIQLNPRLMEVLEAHRVQISEPQDQMVQLNAVRVGPCFTKPGTNVLLVYETTWQVFVDEDLLYVGDDPQKHQAFLGETRDGWQQLAVPIEGDANVAVTRVLDWLESPMRGIARRTVRVGRSALPVPPLDPHVERVGRFVDTEQLKALAVKLTDGQSEVADRAAEVVTRLPTPVCPIIHGRSGSGKTAIAATAACQLIERHYVDRVLQISGAAIAAGAVFWPQRDDRLRHILHVLPNMQRTLVLIEQFDLLLNSTEVAVSLITECLDRGTRLIGVMRADESIYDVETSISLLRRIQPLHVGEPEPEEIRTILDERLSRHPLAEHIEIAPEVVPAVMMLAHLRPGANPGAAVGLLDSLLAHVKWSGSKLATPDDVYHLVQPDQE
jgi:hypothetical protein